MVNVIVRGKTFGEAMDGAIDLADATRGGKGFVVLGPRRRRSRGCAASIACSSF